MGSSGARFSCRARSRACWVGWSPSGCRSGHASSSTTGSSTPPSSLGCRRPRSSGSEPWSGSPGVPRRCAAICGACEPARAARRVRAGHALPPSGVVALCAVLAAAPLAAQRPAPFDQQLRDNQQRLETIRRERSEVEQELERLRSQAHSISDELANIERQKETTNRMVNELDRQISGLSDQIDRTTVDLLLAQNALGEKRAVLEHRLVDIYKRGPLYLYQVLLAAESFGDLLSRYKYLYLVSRQDRLLANDMSKLQRRIGRERQTLVDARDVLGHRKIERTEELDRYLALEREVADRKSTRLNSS